MKKVADKLANFVAKHGRPFEHVTRQKNPGDTPFKYVSHCFFSIYSLTFLDSLFIHILSWYFGFLGGLSDLSLLVSLFPNQISF